MASPEPDLFSVIHTTAATGPQAKDQFPVFPIFLFPIFLDIPECVLYLLSRKEGDPAGTEFKFTPFQPG